MKRVQRQRPFLLSVLYEADRYKRQDLLQHANADQINALSEMTLNRLKQHIPVSPATVAKLRRQEDEDDTSMLNAPLGNTLKKIVKRTKQPVTPKKTAPPSAPSKLIDFDEEEEEEEEEEEVKPKGLIDFDIQEEKVEVGQGHG